MNNPFIGVMPALTTKFDESGNIDYDLFEKNLRFQMQSGVHGVILGGTLGEASTLSSQELRELVRFTVNQVKGTLPVIRNIAESRTDLAIQAAHEAASDGATGLMLLPPMRYKADSREIVDYLMSIANATELPIMLYNNPVDYGNEVTMGMFEELANSCPNIVAVKESTRDISNVTRMRNRFGNRFRILCGVDTLAMESLLMGADGWVAGLVCAFPEETVCIYELIKQEDFAQLKVARTIYAWFLPLLELDINPKLVQNIKLAEEICGIGSAFVRAPRKPLEGEELIRVRGIIEKALASRPQLPTYLV